MVYILHVRQVVWVKTFIFFHCLISFGHYLLSFHFVIQGAVFNKYHFIRIFGIYLQEENMFGMLRHEHEICIPATVKNASVKYLNRDLRLYTLETS